jgi:hypothetical protein
MPAASASRLAGHMELAAAARRRREPLGGGARGAVHRAAPGVPREPDRGGPRGAAALYGRAPRLAPARDAAGAWSAAAPSEACLA